MNKGGLVKRVLKGVGVGAAAGVAGTLLAGAAGAAMVKRVDDTQISFELGLGKKRALAGRMISYQRR